MSKIYVICPYGLITGGPDALHQMVYYLNNNGFDATIVYSDIRTHKYKIPEPYRIYIDKYMLLNEIKDESENAIVVPETETNILTNFYKLNKYVWWLSVDNDIDSSGFKNKLKKILRKIRLKNLKKLYKIYTLKNFVQHKKYDFSMDGNVQHLCASYYALDYVSKNIKDKEKIHLCIEPISKIFLEKSEYVTQNKKNIILYNPKKNYKFSKLIIKRMDEYQFIPLVGFSQEELINMYKKSKVYMDFGHFPGAERIPKEAVINGCCVVTGRFGASDFYNDVPIPDKYKIEANENNINEIILTLNELIKNYEKNVKDYSIYRDTVWSLEGKFIEQLKNIFEFYAIKKGEK